MRVEITDSRPSSRAAVSTGTHTTHTHLTSLLTVFMLVEPPKNGHVGDKHFVFYREIVLSSEVKMY